MRTRLLTAWLLAFLALPAQDVFRVDVRLVRILATVKDVSGDLIGTLGKDDFTILDNGVKQEVAHFERQTAQALSVALLVDTSLSTAKEHRYEIDSASRFLKSLFSSGHPEDTAALYSFSYDITLLASFTRRHDRLDRELRQLKAESGTSMYDAIHLVSKELERRQGRKVIILVTDGGDTTSSRNFHQALEAAQLADAILYAVLVVPITNDAGRNLGGENALAGLAAGTGGRVFVPSAGPEIDAAFSGILEELRTQYFLGYYPRNLPPGGERFHRLEVGVRRPGLRVFARSGYYGDVEPPSVAPPQSRGPALEKKSKSRPE